MKLSPEEREAIMRRLREIDADLTETAENDTTASPSSELYKELLALERQLNGGDRSDATAHN